MIHLRRENETNFTRRGGGGEEGDEGQEGPKYSKKRPIAKLETNLV